MNCKDVLLQDYRPAPNKSFTLLYIGTLHWTRNLGMLLSVVKAVEGVRCKIGGIGSPDIIAQLKKEAAGSSRIEFVGRVPYAEVLSLTADCDAVFSMLDPGDSNSKMGMPNKLFEVMACGRPVLCTRGTYSGDFAEREGIGLAVDYNEDALRLAVMKLRDDKELRETLGRNALKAGMHRYNWDYESKKLIEIYEKLIGR
jgi:glycosyltransferase involved in cell wall biosynthesis